MKKTYVKRLLAFVMAILMVLPGMGVLANNTPNEGEIRNIYFQDEDNRMVAADYAGAIEQSLEEDHTLYNGIKKYVGVTEVKGKPLYLELFNGKVLDYRLAMLDNLFKLQEIIGKEKYEVNHEINYTHELKVIDGVAVIVPRQIDSNYTMDIDGPNSLILDESGNYDIHAYGNGKGNINYRARCEYTVSGGSGRLEYLDGDTWREIPLSGQIGPDTGIIITPDWDVIEKLRFTPGEEGD